MLFGYARISTDSQNLDLQIDALLKSGVKQKNIYTDISSGSKSKRKGLDLLLSKLREEDTVVVWKMDRIARSLSHLIKLVEHFEKEKIHFRSIQEQFIDTTSAHGKFVFSLFGAVAQLERDILIERTKAGLESSRRRGILPGRKKGLSQEAKQKAILAEKYYKENKLRVDEIMKLIDVKSKRTLYKYLAFQGRRNCIVCKKLFWDKSQELYQAYCSKHKGN